MWAQLPTDKINGTFLLFCRFTPERAKEVAAEARTRAVLASGSRSKFYEPAWQNIVPGATSGGDLPERFESILLHKDSLGTSTDQVNAGLLVDETGGIVVWWAHHRHVPFN